MKKQIVVIHGGNSDKTYKKYLSWLEKRKINLKSQIQPKQKGWKETLGEILGKSFEVINPDMPNSDNAKYLEWKIWFEKFTPFIINGVILIGHSLGGIFLAKYLSENKFTKKIKAIFLVAAPYEDAKSKHGLTQFRLPKNLDKLNNQGGQIFIYQSKDDPVVPLADAKKYKEKLPSAKLVIFDKKGHFRQTKFPEIIKRIKNL